MNVSYLSSFIWMNDDQEHKLFHTKSGSHGNIPQNELPQQLFWGGRNLVTNKMCCLPVLLYSEKCPYYCLLSYFPAFFITKVRFVWFQVQMRWSNIFWETCLLVTPTKSSCVFQWSCHKCLCYMWFYLSCFMGAKHPYCLRHSPRLCWYCHDLCTCVLCAEAHAVWESDLFLY